LLPVNLSDDRGSTLLEFLGLGLLLQVSVLTFAISMVSLQHDQLAAEAIARDSLRAFALRGEEPLATASEVAAAYKVQLSRVAIEVLCHPNSCDYPQGWVEITAKVGSATAHGLMLR
jgi:hypothetical protein